MADGAFKITTDPASGDMIYQYPDAGAMQVDGGAHFANLASALTQPTLDSVCSTMVELTDYDDRGRADWRSIITDAYKLLGIGPESDPDDVAGASNTSDHPLMLTALTRFQSKAYAALLPYADRAVRTVPAVNLDDIEDPDEREQVERDASEAGARVERFYAYYLFERLRGYEEDTDQLLHDCGMQGAGVRKIFVDASRQRAPVRPIYINPSDLIVAYDGCRVAHRIRMETSELLRMIQSGQYVVGKHRPHLSPGNDGKTSVVQEADHIIGLGSADFKDGETHTILEIHCKLRLTEDPHPQGLARPYIVTIHSSSQVVLGVTRNWEPDDPDEEAIEHFVVYPFSPGKGRFAPLGLGHLLSNLTRALRDAQRAALDAGYFQNHPSGFKLGGFTVRDTGGSILPGQFVDIDSPVDDVRKALMLHPFQGPSQGLLAVADKIEANGKELGGIASIDFSQLMKAGIAAGPAMAAYEESATFQTAIHRRLYRAFAMELRLIHARMRQVHGNRPVLYGANGVLRPGDLNKVTILPMMKPGEASKQKNILEAQAVFDMSQTMPEIIDPRKAAMKLLRALGEPNIDDVLRPDPDDEAPTPADPVTEYGAILRGDPVAAGASQNHQAHIDAHAAQIKLLTTSQLPVEKGDAAMAALGAHIADHMAKQALVEVAMQTGVPLEAFEKGIPPEVEAQIAPRIAQAMQQLEAAQAPKAGGGERLAVEQVRQQGKQAEMTVKQRHEMQMAMLKHQQALELQELKDDNQMDREEADNAAALEIAAMRGGTASNAGAGTTISAGANANVRARAAAGSGETR